MRLVGIVAGVVGVASVILGGCATTRLEPGAESVRVVHSEAAVEGMEFVDSKSGSLNATASSRLPTIARNFAQSVGADFALIRSSGGNTNVYVIEAWRSRQNSPKP